MISYKPNEAVLSSAKSTVGSLFHSRTQVNPDHPALVEAERTLSYAELESRTNKLANFMLESGLVRGDRVAMLARNCLEYVELEIAAAKTGIIVAALNWRLSERLFRNCVLLV